VVYRESLRAEDQEADLVECLGIGHCQGRCGRRGAEERQMILSLVFRPRHEKPDIGFGSKRVCPDMVPVSEPISEKKPTSSTIFAISGLARNGYVPIWS
jgi:hypothetical protein